MTHHVTHRLVRDYIGRGSHNIDVKITRYKPRAYQAVCLDCDWKSPVGTGTEADNALLKHRDESLAAAQARNSASQATLDLPDTAAYEDLDQVPGRHQLPKPMGGVIGLAATGPSVQRKALGQVEGGVGNTQTGQPVRFAVLPNDMQPEAGIHDAYTELEIRMRIRAETDGDVFMPNPEPPGPVDYVFVCMEPSLGGWASTVEEARAKVDAGFRNFVTSMEDFILHFSIRQYLCGPTQRYYITDLSKGAMPVARAGVDRTQRYDRWYGLLLEELELVAKPKAQVFAVGSEVTKHLRQRRFPMPFVQVMHYSPLAGQARGAGIIGHEASFEAFKGSVHLNRVLTTAEQVLKESVPTKFQTQTLARLARRQLSESQQQLIFNYKLAFEQAVKTRQQAGLAPSSQRVP